MKKFLVGLVMLFVFAVTVPLAADAQTCRCRPVRRSYSRSSYNRSRQSRNSYARNSNSRYANRGYSENAYGNRGYSNGYYANRGYTYQRPSFYRRHRNVINLGIATGGGALIGGIAGGRRGAGVGALVGAGSGALYTYVLNKKRRRY